MKKGNIGVLLRADDWEGFYVDNELIEEGHRLTDPVDWINWTRIFDLIDLKYYEVKGIDAEELADMGNFPEFFTDLKEQY